MQSAFFLCRSHCAGQCDICPFRGEALLLVLQGVVTGFSQTMAPVFAGPACARPDS